MTQIPDDVREKFAQAFPDENQRFQIYQDLEILALKAMVLTSEDEEREYEKILTSLLNHRIKWSRPGSSQQDQ